MLLPGGTAQAASDALAMMSSPQEGMSFSEICASQMSLPSPSATDACGAKSSATTQSQTAPDNSADPTAGSAVPSTPKAPTGNKSAGADLSHPFLPALAMNLVLIPETTFPAQSAEASSSSSTDATNSPEALVSAATLERLVSVPEIFPNLTATTEPKPTGAGATSEVSSFPPPAAASEASSDLPPARYLAPVDPPDTGRDKSGDMGQAVSVPAANTPGFSSVADTGIVTASTAQNQDVPTTDAVLTESQIWPRNITSSPVADLSSTPVVEAVPAGLVAEALTGSDGANQPSTGLEGVPPAIPAAQTHTTESQTPQASQSTANDAAQSRNDGAITAPETKSGNEPSSPSHAQSIPAQLVTPAPSERPAAASHDPAPLHPSSTGPDRVSSARRVAIEDSLNFSAAAIPGSHDGNPPRAAASNNAIGTPCAPPNSPATTFAESAAPRVSKSDASDKNSSDSSQHKDSSATTSLPVPQPATSAVPNTVAASAPPMPVATLQPAEIQAPSPKPDSRALSETSGSLPVLPDGPVAGGAGPVQMAQMVAKSSQSEMRIGLNTPAFGSVEVRTVVHNNDVGIVIGTERGDLRSLMANDLPGITTNLQQQNLRLNQVSFQQPGLAFSGNSSGGNSQYRSFAPVPQPSFTSASLVEPFPAEPVTPLEAPIIRRTGLSILA